ncbi:C19L2-like protein [Mya arenaria]|uniref:C19L2-like protein n=1 Tax=Mya arenaria TaxID=6604 RepID=A0ABY7DQV4_MYAAR|nr:C19L2-like protein [Mya arenaria]
MIRDAEIAKFGRPRTGDQRKRFMKPTDSDNISDSRNSKSSSSGYNRKRSKSPERSRFQRPRSNSRERRDTSRSREKRRSRSRSRERRSRSRDRRSRSRERYRSRDYRSSTSSSLKGRFMKPGDLDNGDKRREASSSSNSKAPSWRKKEFQKPDEDKEEVKRENVDTPRERRRERRKSSSSSDSSSDSSSESTSEDERSKRKSPAKKQPPSRILTEKEMNDLGAKIVKAEILGNEELAAKLKAQLESAREAKKTAPQGQVRVGGQDEEEEEVVTLTRTGRSGMARPVSEGEFPVESGGRRRRKKQTVETHTGKQGERTKYFDDDDKHDLKSLVEREKLGTAEDQNQMFARLAGRASERTDDDFQMDDLILSKADRKQSEAVQEQRDRAAAIFEHKKMGTAMDKCNFCFGKVSKHLIIAIGQKVYLSLPPHQSLTEGHCLIVPMQHVTSSTLFRKTLTRMFTEKDEDVVFMETSMRLKHFPHMCIECVPIEKEVGDMAPIYFKVPKGFPYFAVDFGNEGGFAHVIEDEQKFPHYFGREIIGGMVDADHRLWKKPPRENFDDQRRKVMKFSEMWKPYDWTQNIDKKVNEDSSSSSSDD